MASVVIDAGHGGRDFGASYMGRREKDDNLNLAFAVGSVLENNGVDVFYTRVDDIYDSPYEKAVKGNETGADLFISLHRNATASPNKYSGISTLVFEDSGIRGTLARNINDELEEVGFANLGVIEAPSIAVLRRTKMPAVLVETGFIDNPVDNALFDETFDEIAAAIASGILDTLNMQPR